jgi:hypothetical protein
MLIGIRDAGSHERDDRASDGAVPEHENVGATVMRREINTTTLAAAI